MTDKELDELDGLWWRAVADLPYNHERLVELEAKRKAWLGSK